MPRSARTALLLAAALVLGAVGITASRLIARARATAQANALQLGTDAAGRAHLELQTRTRELEARVAAAAALGPVRALVAHLVDERTLRDAFETEDWWRSFRDDFPVQVLLLGAERYDFGLLERARALQPGRIVGEALKHSPASGVLPVEGAAWLTTAAIVDLPIDPRRRPAAVVLAQPLSAEDLGRLAARAGGAVAVTAADRRVLAAGGPADQERRLRELLTRPVPVLEDASCAAGQRSLDSGLTLWSFADTHLAAEAAHRPAQTLALLLCIGGVLAAGGLVAASFRGARPREEQGLLEATRAELQRTRAELDRLRTPRPTTTGEQVPLTQTLLSHPTPTPFGRYQLLHVLGHGGMATVHLAVSHGVEGFWRFFVVKRLREDVARMPQVVYQFIKEARLGAGLVHSNIVPIFDFGRVGDEYFLAQEYILGRDLNLLVRRARHAEGGGLPPAAVFHLAHEILDALAYAHSRSDPSGKPLSIVHRDVSPMNVMVSRRGEVKLLDFGIAKFGQRDGATTQAGMVKGNVLFMSPEQARGLETDARSDLFSLGLTLYYCLTGEPLYQQDGSDYELLVRAAEGPGPMDLVRISQLPPAAAELLRKALQVDPTQRFQTAEEFLAALPVSEMQAGAAMLLELVERLVGADLAGEEARFADLGRLGLDTLPPTPIEGTTDAGKTVAQFPSSPPGVRR